jgi:hypothetical protein
MGTTKAMIERDKRRLEKKLKAENCPSVQVVGENVGDERKWRVQRTSADKDIKIIYDDEEKKEEDS